jgi:hypothetical protein
MHVGEPERILIVEPVEDPVPRELPAEREEEPAEVERELEEVPA